MRLLALLLALSLPSLASATTLRDRVVSGLQFLQEQQSSGRDGFDPGQWPSYVTSTLPEPVGIGKFGRPFPEPTVFAAASVGNVLAEMSFVDPSLEAVPELVRRTVAGFGAYRWGPVFHYYPPYTYRGVRVRGPRALFVEPQWQGFTNTPPDADSTSSAYLLLAYDHALRAHAPPRSAGYSLPPGAEKALATYRDLGRDPHVFNATHGDVSTGAFLTWLWDERDPRMPRDLFAPPDAGTRIPFGKNDVDCVVNANAVKALTASRATGAPGYGAACAWLNAVVARGELSTCGMYYPGRYALPYAMAAGIELGARCFEPSRAPLLARLLGEQQPDGSWRSDWHNQQPDAVQGTAWALSALLILGNPHDRGQREAARRGVAFLLSQAGRDRHGHLYWNGEIFYAAGFVARRTIVWRSSAYTTAVALRALLTAGTKWGL